MRSIKDKIVAWLLTIMMVFQMMPVTAFAAGDEDSWEHEVVSNIESEVFYTISFVVEEADFEEHVYVKDGESISYFPTAPEVEGKIFKGWFTENGQVTAGSSFTEDAIVRAVYEEAPKAIRTVTFLDQNGRAVETREVEAGNAI